MGTMKYESPSQWKYNFYVVNNRSEFVYGFDCQQEAERYCKEYNHRKHKKVYKTIPYKEAMMYSAGLTPEYEEGWSDEFWTPDWF